MCPKSAHKKEGSIQDHCKPVILALGGIVWALLNKNLLKRRLVLNLREKYLNPCLLEWLLENLKENPPRLQKNPKILIHRRLSKCLSLSSRKPNLSPLSKYR
jgi:hypothetical protein